MAKTEKTKTKKSKEVANVVSQSLAVKYRPRKFADVVGQKNVVTTLKGMFKTGNFPGTILLEGQSGSGKTTIARLILSYINCEKQSACGTCDSCQLGVETHPDLISINAGVDGGVDSIRKLILGSRNTPRYRKKIILVDECHKLTGAAAEAMLVPTEEPSPNTIWILCTTEPDTLKPTLKNRCTRLNIRPIGREDIVARLEQITEKEGHTVNKKVRASLDYISDLANGSMRESISILESVLFAVAGGADFNDKSVIASYASTSEVDLDRASAKFVAALLSNKFKDAVLAVRQASNPRGMLSKSLWLTDNLIASVTKTAKFKPYVARLFDEEIKKYSTGEERVKVSFSSVLILLDFLVELNKDFNRSNVNELLLMQAVVAKYAERVT